MISGKFAITLHILTLLSKHQGEYLSSEFIAASMNINPVLVRKEISNLKVHGLVHSKEGKNGGSCLSVPPHDVTLDDVFRMTFDHVTLGFSKNSPNRECPVGGKINSSLHNLYNDINHRISRQLRDISLLNFADTF